MTQFEEWARARFSIDGPGYDHLWAWSVAQPAEFWTALLDYFEVPRAGSSYPALVGEKVREEAEEVTRAAREESDDRVDNEAADVIYHLLVLLHGRGRTLADVEAVLDARCR